MNQKTGHRKKGQARALHCQYPIFQPRPEFSIDSGIETILHKEKLNSWEKDFLQVFVPPLMGFVRWAVQEAAGDGCERIYFLARDGYLMHTLAEYGKKFWRSPMPELRYLEVSRLSLRRAEYHLLGEKCLDYICAGGADVSLKTILDRAGVSEKMAVKTASFLGLLDRLEKPLSWKQARVLAGRLKQAPGFLEEVYAASRAQYPGTIRYLEKEGFLDGKKCAIVDTGWIGTVRESLERLVGQGSKNIRGYYFGLYELPPGADASLYKTFYFRPWKDIRRKVYFSNSLLEAVWSAPGAQTVGYTIDGCPIHGSRENPNAAKMNREKELLEKLFLDDKMDEQPTPEACAHLLSRFMARPTKRQAEAYGSLLFCDDMLDGSVQEVATPLNEQQLRKQSVLFHIFERTGIYKNKIPESPWLEGSIVRNGKKVRIRLFRVRIYKYFMYIRKYLVHIGGSFFCHE